MLNFVCLVSCNYCYFAGSCLSGFISLEYDTVSLGRFLQTFLRKDMPSFSRIRQFKKKWLSLWPSNMRALRLFERLGTTFILSMYCLSLSFLFFVCFCLFLYFFQLIIRMESWNSFIDKDSDYDTIALRSPAWFPVLHSMCCFSVPNFLKFVLPDSLTILRPPISKCR